MKVGLYALSVDLHKKRWDINGSNDLGTEHWTATLISIASRLNNAPLQLGGPKEAQGVA